MSQRIDSLGVPVLSCAVLMSNIRWESLCCHCRRLYQMLMQESWRQNFCRNSDPTTHPQTVHCSISLRHNEFNRYDDKGSALTLRELPRSYNQQYHSSSVGNFNGDTIAVFFSLLHPTTTRPNQQEDLGHFFAQCGFSTEAPIPVQMGEADIGWYRHNPPAYFFSYTGGRRFIYLCSGTCLTEGLCLRM